MVASYFAFMVEQSDCLYFEYSRTLFVALMDRDMHATAIYEAILGEDRN
jgi:hypothetical protein